MNIILGPIMIFGYLGYPELGIAGAAYATVIGQCVSFLLDAVFHYQFNRQDIDTHLHYIKPQGRIVKKFVRLMFPPS